MPPPSEEAKAGLPPRFLGSGELVKYFTKSLARTRPRSLLVSRFLNIMAPSSQEILHPEAATRTSAALESMSQPTDPSGRLPLTDTLGEKLVLNMGPSHPATHGVLRVVLELDGEIITKATPDVGYLHRGDEKIAENMTYNQFVPYTDRLDYLAPLANNVAYAMAVEKLMGWELPPRGQAIRLICCELARISSHLLGLGAFAMDTGAMTVFLYTFTEREKIYNLCEQISGARFTTSYTRIGGMTRDLWTRLTAYSRGTGFLSIGQRTSVSSRVRTPSLTGCLVRISVDRVSTMISVKSNPTWGTSTTISISRSAQQAIATTGTWYCYDRYLCRVEEMRQSVHIIRQVLDKLPSGPITVSDTKNFPPPKTSVLTKMEELIHHFILHTEGIQAPEGEVYFGAENPKGELGFYIQSRGGGVPYRLKIRAPSFVNLSILDKILPGHMMSDVVSILGSLDFVMGECDR